MIKFTQSSEKPNQQLVPNLDLGNVRLAGRDECFYNRSNTISGLRGGVSPERRAALLKNRKNDKDLTRYGIEPNPGPCVLNLENSLVKEMEIECLQFRIPLVDSSDYIIFEEELQLQNLSSQIPIKLSEETDYIVKLIENLLTFVRLVIKADDAEDYCLAVAVFAQCRSNTSMVSVLLEQWDRIMSFSLQGSDTTNTFQKLRDMLNQYDTIKRLPIFEKLYKFLMYCIGTSLFEKLGVSFDTKKYLKLEKHLIQKEFHLGPDFIHCILDTILYMTETGYQCMVTGSIDPIFHHETSYSKWIAEGELLRVQAKYITNPEPHGFTVFDFLSRLDDNIDKGKTIIKFIHKSDASCLVIRRIMSDLENIRAECKTKRLAQQERKAPFALLVHGGSSVAKSQFTKLLYYHYGKMFNLPIADEYKYTRNAFDQYWTNFNTSQWCLQLDDIAYLHPNNSQGCDPSLTEMLQVINNVPYVPTQADLADKGKTPVRARFVIATSNTENLNAETYFACPLAVQRRLPYIITIQPKAEFAKDGGPMIDPSKIPVSKEGEYPDLWTIVVKRVIAAQNSNSRYHMGQLAEYVVEGRFDNIYEFLKWFSVVARKAEGTQSQAMKCDQDMRQVKLCAHDIPENICPDCGRQVSLQAAETAIVVTPWTTRMSMRFEEEPQPDPRQFTMKYIITEISKCNFMTRLVVFWYMFLLRCCQTDIGAFIIGFFFGRWYFFYMSCCLMHLPEVRQVCIQLIGYRAYRAVRTKKAVIICASIAAAITIIKASSFLINVKNAFYPKKEEVQLQGAAAERGVSPEPKGDKEENVWYKDSFECTTFDVTPSVLSKNNWTLDDFTKYITPNCVSYNIRARTEDTVHVKSGKALCIGGHTYLFNNHCVQYEAFELEIIFQSDKGGITKNIKTLVTPIQLQRFPLKDQCFIQLPSIPPKRDIRDLFVKESFEGRFDGQYISRDLDGDISINSVKIPKKISEYEYNDGRHHIKTNVWSSISDKLTKNGDCGSVLVVKTAMGPMILGIHVLGGTLNQVLAISVTNEEVNNLGVVIFSNNTPVLQAGDYVHHLVDLNKKATVRYIEEGTAEVYGSLSGFRGKHKSRVVPTLMSDIAVREGYEKKTAAPQMNSWKPWRRALLDMSRPVTQIDLTLLAHCAECYTNDILKGLTPQDLEEVHVYDTMTAINGKPGLAYVDKLQRNTSAGFPYKKSKKFFLDPMEPTEGYQHPVWIKPEIEDQMDTIIKNYEKGIVNCPIFTASLKDEPTPIQKVLDHKLRVFCGAPMAWSLVVRKYMLPLIRLIQKNRFLFESGPGTIAQSKEWDEIYQHLIQFGLDRIVAGDYGKFDKRMPASVILAAFGILTSILKAAGWCERDIRVVYGIGEDVAFSTIDFNGELLRCYGTNPSGHPLTVIINGIANSLYVRYCYATLHPEHTCEDFKKHIALMTYGDDMIMGVSKECTWLDHTKMQKVLSDIDIEFTMAEKTAISVPFIHIADATFLRRRWRYEAELEKMVCPIEHASIEKMLTMCVASKTISLQMQALEVMDTACREYFWYGKEVFLAKRAMFLRWIDELELADYQERDLPTWEYLVSEFRRNSAIRD